MGMNLGIIGAGAIGNVHADTATRAGIPIAGVWDVNPAKGAAFSKKHSTARACASVKELLAMKEVDAVVVAVPNIDHAQVACEALEAGNVVHDSIVSEKLGQRRIVRVHCHDDACILGNRDDFFQEVLQVLPQLWTLGTRLEFGSECRTPGNSCFVEIRQTECSHLRAGSFERVDGGANPVGSGHEVVAHQANVEV